MHIFARVASAKSLLCPVPLSRANIAVVILIYCSAVRLWALRSLCIGMINRKVTLQCRHIAGRSFDGMTKKCSPFASFIGVAELHFRK